MKRVKVLRYVLYVLCMAAALVLIAVTICNAMPWPDRYTSRHPAATVPPLMGLSPDSVFNTGDAKALDAFPGVGEVISQRIIDTREYLGGFLLPADLMLVKGIGVKTFEKIMNVFDEVLVERCLSPK